MRTQTAATIMRVLLGIIFMAHGIAKLQMGVGNVGGWFESIGIPGFAAYLVTYLELLGGIALIIGFATRYVSIALIVMLLVAIVTAKLPAGLLGSGEAPGYELDLALIALAAYFAITDEHGIGVDRLLFKK